jgi:small subunit ribosomal protein S8
MHTDPISDLLIRIKNAYKAEKNLVSLPSSKQKKAILTILLEKKYINGFKPLKIKNYEEIEIALNPKIRDLNLKRISKPGQRIYVKKSEIKKVLNGLGISIISTSKGIMTGDEAWKQKLGGEMICQVF